MNLTRNQVKSFLPALRALGGPVDRPFQYDEKTRYAIAKALILLARLAQEIEDWRVAAVKALLKDGERSIDEGTPEHQSFTDQYVAYLMESVEVPGLLKLDAKALVKAGAPFDVVAVLDPILSGVEDL